MGLFTAATRRRQCGHTKAALAHAGGGQTPEVVEVTAQRQGPAGDAAAASEGTVTAKQLASRPLLRPAEVLEVVPGLIISQHSGDGKANQYYLRGFNLDHGTDFAVTLMGMPANMPTHAHGQGYADLQFLIPELVERMQYRKGPYGADVGDFAAAGSASIDYFRKLDSSFADVTEGSYGYRRALVAGSPQLGDGHLLYALEWTANNGPWVPLRAIGEGSISRYGNVDPTDGGQTRRGSLPRPWSICARVTRQTGSSGCPWTCSTCSSARSATSTTITPRN